MRLLVVAQEIDTESSTLGFFHEWLRALAPKFESIEAICLKEGKHSLPENVHVHSLGKEKGKAPSFVYAVRFKLLAWKLRREYDAVFVHMNQEYVLIAGPLWKFLGKRVYMWRNHYAGSWMTDLAALFCTKVFCTSKHSYTAKYKKTILMPVGIDLSRFSETSLVVRAPRSILFLARIAPSKRPDMLIEALGLLRKEGISSTASIVGSPLPMDEDYYSSLVNRAKELGLSSQVTFSRGVSHDETPAIYASHDIFVNCSRSGMFDKTLFEAAAAGCLVLAVSEDFSQMTGDDLVFIDAASLATKLQGLLKSSPQEKEVLQLLLRQVAERESLATLALELQATIL
ncbi:MAG: glycosyltransferase family 4 protein [Candidatus Pacebacteria bacterium]|nr:glycosyltransferase family 4 protein [Candidatus Paceibacterota bacterium]